MNKIKVILLVLAFPIFLVSLFAFKHISHAPKKVLHIASYHYSFDWCLTLNKGIESIIEKTNCLYKVHYMDTKRNNKSEQIKDASLKAIEFIKEWDPDIIITSDDNATKYVASEMKDTDYKFVFTGVNTDPEVYGLPTTNITGVIERKPVLSTLNVLASLLPKLENIVIIGDASDSSKYDKQQFLDTLKQFPEIKVQEIIRTNSYEEFQQKVLFYNNKVDLIIYLPTSTFKNENKEAISDVEVIKWIAKNSQTPEVGTNEMMAVNGGFMSSTPDAFLQGELAAIYAVKILTGTPPSSLPVLPTLKPKLLINKKRAEELNIEIPKEYFEKYIIIE